MSRPIEPPTAFGREVRDARTTADLSQAQLAVHLGVAPSTIYRVERGEDVGESTVARLRDWLDRKAPMDATNPRKAG